MGKYITIVILAISIIFVSIQTFVLFRREHDTGKQLETSTERIKSLSKENEDLQAQLDYFSREENLEKELRSKFNYKKPDEKVMIVTP